MLLKTPGNVNSHDALALTVPEILKFQIFYREKSVKVIRCNFHNEITHWQISQSLKVIPCIFALAFTVLEISTFTMFDDQKVGQGHGVQFSQLLQL